MGWKPSKRTKKGVAPPPYKLMKFTLIGTGFIAPRHLEAINHVGGEVVDVVNDFRGKDEWKEAIKRPEADCIVILTPNDLHYDMIKESLDAGKIVLCEKPLCINSHDVQSFIGEDVFTVLQLRHHEIAKMLKEAIKKDEKYEIEMDISVHRDKAYYDAWKGQWERSGGVLFKIGIHYFDMLLYLFGKPLSTTTFFLDDKQGSGSIEGANYKCNWHISTEAKKDKQKREFKINGISYNFSSKDNLSYGNLHREVYKDLLEGKGVKPKDILGVTELIEQLNSNPII